MIPKEIETSLKQRLGAMIDRDFIYRNNVVRVLNFMVGTGEKGNDIEIYLNDGRTIDTNYVKVQKILEDFQPLQEQARVLQRRESATLSVCGGGVVTELRDTLLDQLRAIRENPSKEVLAQSKAVNETVSVFTNLARAELEYKKFSNQLSKG